MDGIKVKKRTALSAGEAVAGCLRTVFGSAINGVFPDKARTNINLPYIIYQVDGDMETNDKSRSSFLDSCTVTLHCFACRGHGRGVPRSSERKHDYPHLRRRQYDQDRLLEDHRFRR